MDLNYNSPGTGIGQQWNGNISAMTYNTTQGSNAGTHQFVYSYDPLNRLHIATSTGGQLDETMSYDKMGNIDSLTRGGASAKNLGYHYIDANGNYSNQLQTVQNNQSNFRVYGYDQNGNATSDGDVTAAAGIKTINYNLLNLPQSITQGGNTAATYIYNAGGNKLRNIGNSGTWDYDNGVIYQNNVLSFIQTEEGRISYSNGTYNYEYNLKDHLGNTRVSFDK